MFGPYTPTLLAILTRNGHLSLTRKPLADFAGKVAVITGAASGIGAALAQKCARAGCVKLVLADITWERDCLTAHPLLQELRSQHPQVELLPAKIDVAKKDEIYRLRDLTVESFGAPHLLFNNAGTGMPGVLSATEEALSRSFDINFWSVVHGMRAFIPDMEALPNAPPCYIVNTSSLAGISEATGLYGVTKHAVVAATEAVGSELNWRNSNVEVAVLCPSYVSSNVVRTTAQAGLKSNVPPNFDASRIEKVQEDLKGLAKLVSGGMSPAQVSDIVFEGMAEGKRYMFTDMAHTEASIEDRVEQMRAGGLPKGFQRRMEQVIADATKA